MSDLTDAKAIKNQLFANHLQRVRAGIDQAHVVTETSKWISENTYIRGKPYSYVDHEYQERILNSHAQEVVIRKCSQVGISELAIRKALALCGMIKNFTAIYTFPTAGFAATVAKTRVDPVIKESPYLKELMTDIDNMDVKQLGTSYLYLKGAASTNAPISIPADCLIHDELDFSDPLVISQYQSRLTHSPHKYKIKLSTPTLPGKGIDFEFQRSKRYFMFVKCNHCNHQFIPDYYEHVRLPSLTVDLHDIVKRNLHQYDYKSAFVVCPHCGKEPDLGPDHREWVSENSEEQHVAEGFQVAPFDAPAIINAGYLIEASTQYTNIADFVNFGLGLPYFSQESVLAPAEIEGVIVQSRFDGAGSYVMGVDLGKTCHILIAACGYDGSMQVVHLEHVPLAALKERYKELRINWRVRVSVIDSLPYTDVIMALQAIDSNLWASVYTQTKGIELFTVKKKDDDEEEGVQKLRQLNVARDRTFDALMAFVRSGQFSKVTCEHDKEFVEHCTDMRRVKDWNMKSQVIEFKWLKSDAGNDHFWFCLQYAYIASQLLGTSSGTSIILPLVYSFRVDNKKVNG